MTLKWHLTLFAMFYDLKVTFEFFWKALRPYSDIWESGIILTEDLYKFLLSWRFLQGYVRHYTWATTVAHIPWISQYLLSTNKWIIRRNTEEYNMVGKLTWATPSRNHETPMWRTIALQKIHFMRTKCQLLSEDGRRGFSCFIIGMKYRDKLGFYISWQKITVRINILVLS